MNFGDRVIFTEGGVDYQAIVLRQRYLDDHLGANDEPLLDLGFFKPVMKPGPDGIPVIKDVVGTEAQSELVQFRIDVAHETHEFSDAEKRKYHLQYNGVRRVIEGEVEHHVSYPGGRWKELVEEPVQGNITDDEEKSLVPVDNSYREDSETFSPEDGDQGTDLPASDPEENLPTADSSDEVVVPKKKKKKVVEEGEADAQL